MTTQLDAPRVPSVSSAGAHPRPTHHDAEAAHPASARTLLRAGLAAGPLFLGVAAVLATVRDGYDPTVHPISALSLGSGGGIQIASFIVTGVLVVLAALGLRRALDSSRAVRWGTALVGVYGAGFVAAGVFSTDPADGFPLGTPDRAADALTSHAQIHAAASMVSFVAVAVAMLVLARPLGRRYGARVRTASWIVPAACLMLMAAPTQSGFGVRIAIACALAFAWIAVVSRLAARPTPSSR